MAGDGLTQSVHAPTPGPLGLLPVLSGRALELQRALASSRLLEQFGAALAWLSDPLGGAPRFGPAEVLDRPSGLGRPGVIAQFAWPARSTRLGLGIETALAHAIVDRLLGFDRQPGEGRLQVTPVEWGVLTYVIARTLAELAPSVPSATAPDLVLDRVGPESFSTEKLGQIVTLRWPLRVNRTDGCVRLWLPRPVLAEWPLAPVPRPPVDRADLLRRFGNLAGAWLARAGAVTLPRGPGRLRTGAVLPIDGSPLRGTPGSPNGPVELTLGHDGGRAWFSAEVAPLSGGGRLVLRSTLLHEPRPREPLPLSIPSEPNPVTASPADLPVTLAVELGRITLPLLRLADLKAGDVLELGRHAREPVELTSNGKLVARGELVQIDTELGVRITHVFL